jgi:serine protease Do
MSVGKSYDMAILRDGKRQTVKVTMKPMPKQFTLGGEEQPEEEAPAPSAKENKYDELGLEIQDLTPQLAKQFGYGDKTEGVLVSAVEPNSVADRAGVRAGHVIEKVGTTRVASAKEFDEAVKQASLKEGILLLLRSPEGSRFVVLNAKP